MRSALRAIGLQGDLYGGAMEFQATGPRLRKSRGLGHRTRNQKHLIRLHEDLSDAICFSGNTHSRMAARRLRTNGRCRSAETQKNSVLRGSKRPWAPGAPRV